MAPSEDWDNCPDVVCGQGPHPPIPPWLRTSRNRQLRWRLEKISASVRRQRIAATIDTGNAIRLCTGGTSPYDDSDRRTAENSILAAVRFAFGDITFGDIMGRLKLWRVRVLRQREDWVDVESSSKIHAEIEARKVPGVVNVFPGSAVMVEAKLLDHPVVEEE